MSSFPKITKKDRRINLRRSSRIQIKIKNRRENHFFRAFTRALFPSLVDTLQYQLLTIYTRIAPSSLPPTSYATPVGHLMCPEDQLGPGWADPTCLSFAALLRSIGHGFRCPFRIYTCSRQPFTITCDRITILAHSLHHVHLHLQNCLVRFKPI
jgi:hypothetical protein